MAELERERLAREVARAAEVAAWGTEVEGLGGLSLERGARTMGLGG